MIGHFDWPNHDQINLNVMPICTHFGYMYCNYSVVRRFQSSKYSATFPLVLNFRIGKRLFRREFADGLRKKIVYYMLQGPTWSSQSYENLNTQCYYILYIILYNEEFNNWRKSVRHKKERITMSLELWKTLVQKYGFRSFILKLLLWRAFWHF